MAFKTYHEVLAEIGGGRKHLLLGNGFSIGCSQVFHYDKLYTKAEPQLSPTAKAVFQRIGENNFEGALRLLEDIEWGRAAYGLGPPAQPPAVAQDLQGVKDALVAAISATHVATIADIAKAKRDACVAYLSDYFDIYTTNYDLLLYWALQDGLQAGALSQGDGFTKHTDAARVVTYPFIALPTEHRAIVNLHGALHLYAREGSVYKYSWTGEGRPILETVRTAIQAGEYPLFVAEGLANKKYAQIQGSPYLRACLDRLTAASGPLVTYGFGFTDADMHIKDAISKHPGVDRLYVGVHDPDGSAGAWALRARCAAMIQTRRLRLPGWPLAIEYYDSKTAQPWGP